ncbi:MAG: hypothetical protein U1E19_10085 [Rhodoblastus sp.]
MIALSQILVEQRGRSKAPLDAASLEALPGVGRKTANVVRRIAFGEATIAWTRILPDFEPDSARARCKTPLEVELGLLKIIPQEFLLHAHHRLILHGRRYLQGAPARMRMMRDRGFVHVAGKDGLGSRPLLARQ